MSCLGKSKIYFSADEQAVTCDGPLLTLKDFWFWHAQGETDAVICERHRQIWEARYRPSNRGRPTSQSHLNERIQEAKLAGTDV